MIDKSTRKQLAERKERVRRRINTKVDPENYEFIPAKKPIDYYDNDIRQRVAVYARVSTDNVQQTSSYELQKKYYCRCGLCRNTFSVIRLESGFKIPDRRSAISIRN